MKKDILYILLQFSLFAIYFMDGGLFSLAMPSWFVITGAVIGFLGIVVVVFGILNLNDNLTPFPTPKDNSVLISTGIYKYVRHPIYSGILIGLLGFALYSTSLFKLTIVIVLAIVFYFKSNFEEQLLMQRYDEYMEYKRKTGRFFPKLRS